MDASNPADFERTLQDLVEAAQEQDLDVVGSYEVEGTENRVFDVVVTRVES